MSEIPSSNHFIFSLPRKWPANGIINTHNVAILFMGSNVLMMWCVYPVCWTCLLIYFFLHIPVVFLLLLIPGVSVQKPIILFTGWMRKKERPSEWKQSSLSSRKMRVLSTLWRKIAGLHYYIYYGCIHVQHTTRLNVLNRDDARVKISLCLSLFPDFFSLHKHFIVILLYTRAQCDSFFF